MPTLVTPMGQGALPAGGSQHQRQSARTRGDRTSPFVPIWNAGEGQQLGVCVGRGPAIPGTFAAGEVLRPADLQLSHTVRRCPPPLTVNSQGAVSHTLQPQRQRACSSQWPSMRAVRGAALWTCSRRPGCAGGGAPTARRM